MLRKSKLTGFTLPQSKRKLIVSLFADDTCVFLSKHDDPAILQDILDTWFTASGAKFNIHKTEVIPIGSPAHREKVIRDRRLDDTTSPFAPRTKIAIQGEATCLLGAHIGNGVNQQGTWITIRESIRDTLKHWNERLLTITAKCLIVQFLIGGKTQYLMTVQGMPKETEDELTEMILEFVWVGKQ
ncbi:hypothetical protein EXIGLDRAFT_589663, partial [Exidia glandulosa HHB12029]